MPSHKNLVKLIWQLPSHDLPNCYCWRKQRRYLCQNSRHQSSPLCHMITDSTRTIQVVPAFLSTLNSRPQQQAFIVSVLCSKNTKYDPMIGCYCHSHDSIKPQQIILISNNYIIVLIIVPVLTHLCNHNTQQCYHIG